MQEFHDPAYPGETRMHNIPGITPLAVALGIIIPYHGRKVNRQEKNKPSLLRAFLSSTLNPMGSKLELFYRLSFTCYAFDLKGIHKSSRYRRRAERHIFSAMIMRHEQVQRRQFFFFRQDTDMPSADYTFVCHCAVALILKVLQFMLAVHFK